MSNESLSLKNYTIDELLLIYFNQGRSWLRKSTASFLDNYDNYDDYYNYSNYDNYDNYSNYYNYGDYSNYDNYDNLG